MTTLLLYKIQLYSVNIYQIGNIEKELHLVLDGDLAPCGLSLHRSLDRLRDQVRSGVVELGDLFLVVVWLKKKMFFKLTLVKTI